MASVFLFGDGVSVAYHEAKHILDDIAESIDPSLSIGTHALSPIDWLLNQKSIAAAFADMGDKDKKVNEMFFDVTGQSILIIHSLYGTIGALDELIAWYAQHHCDSPHCAAKSIR